MNRAVLWFRRDLRLRDHPALRRAADTAREVLPLVVLDPHLLESGGPRVARLAGSVGALHEATAGALLVVSGPPELVVPEVAARVGAREVHVTGETTPYGRSRDLRVAAALERRGVRLVETGTPYAVPPGTLTTGSGTPYRVFTPFLRAWRARVFGALGSQAALDRDVPGLPRWVPAEDPAGSLRVLRAAGAAQPPAGGGLWPAGERAALERWSRFLEDGLAGYATARDRPDLDATSRLSVSMKYGEIHPRTLLAALSAHRLGDSEDGARFVAQVCWREFHADVLSHRPEAAWDDLVPVLGVADQRDAADEEGVAEEVEAWGAGRTGYPLVDAGMRQLLAEGWMHNRVRMVTASFLVKDLRVRWQVGARHFLRHLLDADLASNNQGWQWVAGTGTDAAPYHRVFNPVRQGLRFDPEGEYVRRWVPELAHLPGAAAHEPWRHAQGYAAGYPARIVDHGLARAEALALHRAARAVSRST